MIRRVGSVSGRWVLWCGTGNWLPDVHHNVRVAGASGPRE